MRLIQRRVTISLVLLLLIVASVLHPAVHWRVIGWWRADAIYQGRPTSYWVNEIEASYQPIMIGGSSYVVPLYDDGRAIWCVERSASLWNQVLDRVMPRTPQLADLSNIVGGPLLDGDPAALPMLLALVRNESAKVRHVAISGLVAQGREKLEVITALQEAVNDQDDAVREAARVALGQKLGRGTR
ncbi:hypothetical protein AYO44_12135 [Planctomycetaceae bacterium SCGC AG-212-F19]|nr:hypothetical protein AYO44_12135 [Planctomycetaceae bacterium SCGC AG-212-F19]